MAGICWFNRALLILAGALTILFVLLIIHMGT